ncbi:MFS transporter [Iodobacter arcticus]|uniref:MFS transporter n=1 Tax=Iodobacter arcticus TaxID=590593 RepID=A0ABW2QY90_9NEIS
MLLTSLRAFKNRLSDLPQMAWGLAAALFVNRLGVMVKLFMALYLRESLGLSIDTIGWLLAGSGAGLLLGSYAIGVLSDHMPTGKLAVRIMLASGVALASLTLIHSVWLLALVLFISGVLDGGAKPLYQRLIMENCSLEERPRAQALNRVAVNLAVSIAGILGGVLAGWDYRLLILVSAAMSLLAAAWLAWALRRWAAKPREVVLAADESTPSQASPYADWPFISFLLAGVLLALAYDTVNAMLGNYLLDFYQLGAGALGWQFTINGLLVVALQIPITSATQAWGERGQLAVGAVLLAAGLLMLPFGSGFAYVCISTVIWTLGEILFMPTMSVLVMQRAEGRQSGHYFGLYAVCWSSSMLISPVFGSQLYTHFGGHSVWFGCAAIALLALPLMDRAATKMAGGLGLVECNVG